MTNRHDTTRLSDYLDGELTSAERAELEAHLAECPECTRTLEELRAVVETAERLPELPPERELWPGIEARLAPRTEAGVETGVLPLPRYRRRVLVSVPQLAAAAVALVLFSAGAVWLAVGGRGDLGPAPDVAAVESQPPAAATMVTFTGFEDAIRSLEAEYRTRRSDLDPETVRVVERNLAIIDQAIGEARAALATDPSSGFLSTHLANAMRQKMELLRRAATIAESET